MTSDPSNPSKTPFRLPPLLEIERATGELRRGAPIIISGADAAAYIYIAAELATDQTLDVLREASAPRILLTHNRAKTLKIRLYTPELVALPLSDNMPADQVKGLADPAEDLGRPFRGPFDTLREPLPRQALAAVKLTKYAGLLPAGLIAAVNETQLPSDMLGRPTTIHAETVEAYEKEAEAALVPVTAANVPLTGAVDSRIMAFRPTDGGPEHLAIIIGDASAAEAPLIRLHSECFTGDLLGSLKCDCGEQLRGSIDAIAEEGSGILLYLAQEGRGIGLMNKLRAYALQDQGFDTVEANERLGFDADERVFAPAASMLRHLGITTVRLLTNNPDKVRALSDYGITVAERISHKFPANEHNWRYLDIKKSKTGHYL
jgi:GTP cyclohydrolase II